MARCARRLSAGSAKSSRVLVRRPSTRTEVLSAKQTTTASFRTTSTKANASARKSVATARASTKTSGAVLRPHQTVRSSIGAELGSLRYLSYLVEGGAEPNLLRGWDDGIVDAEGDDGT